MRAVLQLIDANHNTSTVSLSVVDHVPSQSVFLVYVVPVFFTYWYCST